MNPIKSANLVINELHKAAHVFNICFPVLTVNIEISFFNAYSVFINASKLKQQKNLGLMKSQGFVSLTQCDANESLSVMLARTH
ncbi:hypothetical protein BCU68_09465 [Vibrio sp. 10N.286.49.B3]|nr:hypothetical protein BCU68_09465 [Vibrio sp. 10N.286.49.B3]